LQLSRWQLGCRISRRYVRNTNVTVEGSAQHGSPSGFDPAKRSLAHFIGGQDTPFNNPLFERIQISLEGTLYGADSPHFTLSAHLSFSSRSIHLYGLIAGRAND
jgi:hypothetical protein